MSWNPAELAARVTEKIVGVLPDLFTSDDERNKTYKAVAVAVNGLVGEVLTFVKQQESERTDRHANDMNSDSVLSKNIRPSVLVVLTAFYIAVVVLDSMPREYLRDLDGNVIYGPPSGAFIMVDNVPQPAAAVPLYAPSFTVKERWVVLLDSLMMAVYGFYFVMRGVEKISRNVMASRAVALKQDAGGLT